MRRFNAFKGSRGLSNLDLDRPSHANIEALLERAALETLGVPILTRLNTPGLEADAGADDQNHPSERHRHELSFVASAATTADPSNADGATGLAETRHTAEGGNHPVHSVAFIDQRVTRYLELAEEIDPNVEVVFLDANVDGVQQIADWLEGHRGIDAVHIVSHGAEASLQLGSSELNSSTLSTYGDLLSKIGAALSSEADILLYGCDVASMPMLLPPVRSHLSLSQQGDRND